MRTAQAPATATETTEIEVPAAVPDPQLELDVAPAAATPAAGAPKPTEVEAGIERLKEQLAAGEREKQAALDRARAAETDAATARAAETAARTEVHDSRISELTSAIARVKQTKEVLRASYAEAAATGDHMKMAELQEQMTDAAVDLRQLERGKADAERAPKPKAPVAAPPSDPVEFLASQLSPRSAAWVRAHPDYATGTKFEKMVAADRIARADGHKPDTDGYFDSVEETLKLRTPAVVTVDDADLDTTPQQATGGRSSAPVAPVSRGGTGNGSKPRTIRLTPEMREIAKLNGLTDEQYARNLQELRDEGKIH